MHNDQDTNDLYAFAVDLQLPSSHVSSGITPWLFSAHVKSNSYPSFHYFLILFFFRFCYGFLTALLFYLFQKLRYLKQLSIHAILGKYHPYLANFVSKRFITFYSAVEVSGKNGNELIDMETMSRFS